MAQSVGYHEPFDQLSAATRDIHRALVSLQEELEAVDWYRQRADVCEDEELRQLLLHNMREEIEHATMLLEWLRRRDEHFAGQMKNYLFTDRPILEVEAAVDAEEVGLAPVQAPRNPLTVGILKEPHR